MANASSFVYFFTAGSSSKVMGLLLVPSELAPGGVVEALIVWCRVLAVTLTFL
jgi:hypothetical protein